MPLPPAPAIRADRLTAKRSEESNSFLIENSKDIDSKTSNGNKAIFKEKKTAARSLEKKSSSFSEKTTTFKSSNQLGASKKKITYASLIQAFCIRYKCLDA